MGLMQNSVEITIAENLFLSSHICMVTKNITEGQKKTVKGSTCSQISTGARE